MKVNSPKRLRLSIILLVASFFSLSLLAETFQLGDVAPRGAPDGQLNAADSLILQRIILGEIIPTDNEMLIGDVAPLGVSNGILNAGDLVVLRRAVIGQVSLGTIETDTTPPESIDVGAISIDSSVVNRLTISGLAGAVEPNAIINITNATTSQNYVIVADSSGAFLIEIAGQSGNTLLIMVEDNANNTSDTTKYIVGAIQIVTPISAEIIDDDTVNVYGTFTGPVNTGVLINGIPACVKGNVFYVNNVGLINGASNISAVLTYQDGSTSSQVIQVNGSVSSHISASVSNNCSLSPLTANFNVALPNATIRNIVDRNGDDIGDPYYNSLAAKLFEIDYDGDGTVDESSVNYISGALQYTFALPGIYESVIRVTDGLDVIHTENIYVVVLDDTEFDDILQITWDGMWTSLKAGDKFTALTYVSPDSRSTYNTLFDALMPNMTAINNRMTGVRRVSATGNIASGAILKNGSGQNKFYMINFTKDYDGVWRIDSM